MLSCPLDAQAQAQAHLPRPRKIYASKNSNKKGGQSAQLLTTYNSDHTNNLPQERRAVEENLWLPAIFRSYRQNERSFCLRNLPMLTGRPALLKSYEPRSAQTRLDVDLRGSIGRPSTPAIRLQTLSFAICWAESDLHRSSFMEKREPPTIGSMTARSLAPTASSDTETTLPVITCGIENTAQAIDVVAEAFLNDPTWSWAFPDPAARKIWWTLCIANAFRYPCAFATSGFETLAVWIPPSGTEFSKEAEDAIPALVKDLVGPRAPEVSELLNRFERAHPHAEPHYYLSLLATQTEHRGRGLGMALLRENLMRIDSEHMPAYLESSNPANNKRYQSAGFEKIIAFQAPGHGPIVTGMWRKARK
jgi:ribosomal protein S18 acetylase RimI-like enzyme